MNFRFWSIGLELSRISSLHNITQLNLFSFDSISIFAPWSSSTFFFICRSIPLLNSSMMGKAQSGNKDLVSLRLVRSDLLDGADFRSMSIKLFSVQHYCTALPTCISCNAVHSPAPCPSRLIRHLAMFWCRLSDELFIYVPHGCLQTCEAIKAQ